MAHVELRVEGKEPQLVKLERSPVKGDYVVGRMGVLLVNQIGLTPGAMTDAIAFCEAQDPNASPHIRGLAEEGHG